METKQFDNKGILIGIIAPIISLIYALLHPKHRYFTVFAITGFAYYGLANILVPGGGALNSSLSSDAASEAYLFVQLSEQKISFIDYYNSLPISNQIDYYAPFMRWFLSRMFSSPYLYNYILTLVVGIFLTLNVKYIIDKANIRKGFLILIPLLFLTSNPNFCSHRWWTALQVFLYGSLPLLLDRNYKSGAIAILSILIHFSFLYPVIILFVSIFFPKKKVFPYLIIYIILKFADTIDFTGILKFSEQFLPEAFNSRNESYINYELQAHNLWSQTAKYSWSLLSMIGSLCIYIYCKQKLETDDKLRNLFIMSLLLGSFASVGAMTEWGWRYLDLANFLLCSLYILILSDNECYTRLKPYFTLLKPFMLFIIIFQVRGVMANIGLINIWGNYFSFWFIEDNNSILSLIK